MARSELKFSRYFDRVLELRQAGQWSAVHNGTAVPKEIKNCYSTPWDELLEEAWYMARDFEQERIWKKTMAKALANEARQSLKTRKSSPLRDSRFFYPPTRQVLSSIKQVYSPGSGLVKQHSIIATADPRLDIDLLNNGAGQEESSLATATTGEEKEVESSANIRWSDLEDLTLLRLVKLFGWNSAKVICYTINALYHGNRPVRSNSDLQSHFRSIISNNNEQKSKHNAALHLNRIQLMNSTMTKLISAKPISAPKKLTLNPHPSHEAAARKANQNISKLLTPQELALRRIQRTTTRIITDPASAAVAAAALMSIPRPPPSPNLQQQSQQHQHHLQNNPRPPAQMTTLSYQAAVAAAAGGSGGASNISGLPMVMLQNTPNMSHMASTNIGQMANIASLQNVPNMNIPIAASSIPATAQNTLVNASSRPPTAAVRPITSNVALAQQQQQQQRQALLNRSQQIGTFISSMHSQNQPCSATDSNRTVIRHPQSRSTVDLASSSSTTSPSKQEFSSSKPNSNPNTSPYATRRKSQQL